MVNQPEQGFVLVCDRTGLIRECVLDGLDIDGGNALGRPWKELLDDASQEKAARFMEAVARTGAAFDWELNMPMGPEVKTIRFAGVDLADRIMIVAARTPEGVSELFEAFMRMNNEQTNTLRAVFKENVNLKAQDAQDNERYDEISRLNNELVNLQRKLTKQNHELERLNREKNQFLGMAAHDLRNPLGNIMTYAEILRGTIEDPESEQAQFTEQIRNLSQFMLSLITDLLDASVIESGRVALKLQPFDFLDLLREQVELNRNLAAQKDIEITLEAAASDVVLDRNKLAQVISNLITNAIKFSMPDTLIKIRSRSNSDTLILEVEDQGQGIPHEEQEQIFQPFRRSRTRSTAGERSTGLGLFITRRIVEAHGGTISLESTEGQGTTFRIHLPLKSREGSNGR